MGVHPIVKLVPRPIAGQFALDAGDQVAGGKAGFFSGLPGMTRATRQPAGSSLTLKPTLRAEGEVIGPVCRE